MFLGKKHSIALIITIGSMNIMPLQASYSARFGTILQRGHRSFYTGFKRHNPFAHFQKLTPTIAITANRQQQNNRWNWDFKKFSFYSLLSSIGFTTLVQQKVHADEEPEVPVFIFITYLRSLAKNPENKKLWRKSISYQHFIKHSRPISLRLMQWDFVQDGFEKKLATLPMKTIFSQEEENSDDYEVFYHAHQGQVRIAQDLFFELTNFLNGPINNKEFIFLRNPLLNLQASHISHHPDEYNPLLWQQSQEHYKKWFDNESRVRNQLLSVNLHLFGNIQRPGESSLLYYCNNNSCWEDIKTVITQLCTDYDFNDITQDKKSKSIFYKNTESTFCKIARSIQSRGNLLQIFIPKKYVPKCAYIACPGGRPLCNDIFCPHFLALSKGAALKDICFNCDPQVTSDSVQARIILDHEIMLNPNSGVKIFRYTQSSLEEEQQYQKLLKKTANEMFVEWLERLKKDGVKQEALERINNTELGQKIVQRSGKTGRLEPQPDAIDAEIARLRQQMT